MIRFRPAAVVCAAVTLVLTSSACFHFPEGPYVDFGRDCEVDADCDGYTPPPFAIFDDERCTETFCEDRRCAARPRVGALPDDVDGDCSRPTCVDGTVTHLYDGADAPRAPECRVPSCESGSSGYDAFMPDGTSCSIGICRVGNCVPVVEDAGRDAGDAGDPGHADAGDADAGEAG